MAPAAAAGSCIADIASANLPGTNRWNMLIRQSQKKSRLSKCTLTMTTPGMSNDKRVVVQLLPQRLTVDSKEAQTAEPTNQN